MYSCFVFKTPKYKSLTDNIHFSQAIYLRILLPESDNGKAHVFIDDITPCTVDVGKIFKHWW